MVSTSTELITKAVENHAFFKHAARQLEALPPDAEATAALVSAFRSGKAPAWLVAHLLGCVGHETGYDVVREILLAAPGLLAESYAGPALVRIAGEQAFDELASLLKTAEKRPSREGAAYGLGELGSEKSAAVLFEAAHAGLIRCHISGGILARLPARLEQITDLLSSCDNERVRLGTEILWMMILAGDTTRKTWLSVNRKPLEDAVRYVMANPSFTMAPRKRQALTAWIATGEQGV